MYDIDDFIPYVSGDLPDDREVLAWSKQTGYYFTTFKEAVEASVTIVAQEEKYARS